MVGSGTWLNLVIFCLYLLDVVGVVGVQRPLSVLEDSVVHLDTKTLVLFFVKLHEQLTCVDGGFAT